MKSGIALVILLFSICFPLSADCAIYPMPARGNDIVGHAFTIRIEPGDSLDTIRRRYDVSYYELLEANPDVNFYRLRVGKSIIIPTEYILPKYRRGIVINIAELRLYYFTPDGRFVYTFPVGLGRIDWRTPTAVTRVIKKETEPVWRPPDSIREYTLEKTGELLPEIVLPGPKNPLGHYALYLSKSGYLIHGTNVPGSVGTFISSGCMRLLDDAIETLYNEVGIGTPVYIVHHQNKAGWFGNTLYLESQAPAKQYAEQLTDLSNMDAETAIYQSAANRPAYVNWNIVSQAVQSHTGLPVPVGQRYELMSKR